MDKKGLVAIFIIIAIVIVLALLIWGFVSLGGDDASSGDVDAGLTVIDDGVDAETGSLLQESFVDDNDDLGLGEVI